MSSSAAMSPMQTVKKSRQAPGRRRVGAPADRTVVPLYHQVYVVLREKIRAGRFDAAQPLPGEHQLAAEFGVSRVTIRRTLQTLELDGLIERRPGVGTFAVPHPVEFRDRYNIGGLVQRDGRDEASAQSRNLCIARIPPPAHVARRLGSDAEVLLIQRLRHIGDEPFTLLSVYLPHRVADRVSQKALQGLAVVSAIEQAGFYLARTEQAISARAADEQAARELRLPIGAPLIFMTSLFSDRADRPLALLEALYRPDLYEYRTTMVRRGRGGAARWRPLL